MPRRQKDSDRYLHNADHKWKELSKSQIDSGAGQCSLKLQWLGKLQLWIKRFLQQSTRILPVWIIILCVTDKPLTSSSWKSVLYWCPILEVLCFHLSEVNDLLIEREMSIEREMCEEKRFQLQSISNKGGGSLQLYMHYCSGSAFQVTPQGSHR